jgi:probable selenium-dependent hydroxylase accessory protein YqeC
LETVEKLYILCTSAIITLTMNLLKRLKPLLSERTELSPAPIITFTGGGGKTTAIFALARSASQEGLRVLVTTTTMMIDPRLQPAVFLDRFIMSEAPDAHYGAGEKKGSISFAASEPVKETPKLRGFPGKIIAGFTPYYDLVLVEGDGAKHRPVKAPAPHEPVIPGATNIIIGMIGLDCLGKPMDGGTVHRPELFGPLTSCPEGSPIGAEHLLRLVESPAGLFKSAPEGARRVVLFNKLDILGDRADETVKDLEALFRNEGNGNADMLLFGSSRIIP